jgi:hypothetical protein
MRGLRRPAWIRGRGAAGKHERHRGGAGRVTPLRRHDPLAALVAEHERRLSAQERALIAAFEHAGLPEGAVPLHRHLRAVGDDSGPLPRFRA